MKIKALKFDQSLGILIAYILATILGKKTGIVSFASTPSHYMLFLTIILWLAISGIEQRGNRFVGKFKPNQIWMTLFATLSIINLWDLWSLNRFWPSFLPDSPTYLVVNELRGITLTSILKNVTSLPTGLRGVTILNFIVVQIGIFLLASSVWKLNHSLKSTILLVFLLQTDSSWLKYVNLVLSEALFYGVLCIFLSRIVVTFHFFSRKNLLSVFAALSVLIVIRPIGVAFAIPVFILLYLNRNRFYTKIKLSKMFLISFGILSSLTLISSIPSFFNPDLPRSPNIGKISLLGQTLHYMQTSKQDEREPSQSIYVLVNKASTVKQSTNPKEYSIRMTNEWNAITWGIAWPEIGKYVEKKYPQLNNIEQERKKYDLALEIGMDNIKQNPDQFVKSSLIQWIAAWYNSYQTFGSATMWTKDNFADTKAYFETQDNELYKQALEFGPYSTVRKFSAENVELLSRSYQQAVFFFCPLLFIIFSIAFFRRGFKEKNPRQTSISFLMYFIQIQIILYWLALGILQPPLGRYLEIISPLAILYLGICGQKQLFLKQRP